MKLNRFISPLILLISLLAGLFGQSPLRTNAYTYAMEINSAPVGQSTTNWTPTFNDEFDNTLNRAVWGSDYPNGGNGELQQYVSDNSRNNYLVQDSSLQLIARKESYNNRAYTSGIIHTQHRFFQKYGYFEMRARIPSGKGLWPAFWLMPNPGEGVPEIDVMEILGQQPNITYMTFHYDNDAGVYSQDQTEWTGPNFSADWHTFAIDWQPGSLTWYVDGVAQKEITDAAIIPNVPMFILANLAVGGTWPGSPNSTTTFPSSYAIDYIRVWQRPDLVTPTPVPTNNLIKNASFEEPESYPWNYPWSFRNDLNASFTQDSTTAANNSKASLKISLPTADSKQPWVVSASQPNKPLSEGQAYTLSFWAKASTNRVIHAIVQEQNSPFTEYDNQAVNLSSSWTRHEFTFTSPVNTTNAMVNINLADAAGNIWMDDIALCQAGLDCSAPTDSQPSPSLTPTLIPATQTPAFTPTATKTATARPTATVPTTSDITPPIISINSPVNNTLVRRNSKVSIKAAATDSSGIARVDFMVNSKVICSDTTAPYSCSWLVPNTTGVSYTITAKALDRLNNASTASIKLISKK